jgi:hypothetical protein
LHESKSEKMKLILYTTILLFSYIASSCDGITFSDTNSNGGSTTPPCETNNTGQMCFQNNRDKDIRVEIDGVSEGRISPNEIVCFDLAPSSYHFKVEKTEIFVFGRVMFDGDVQIDQCSEDIKEFD